MIKIQGQYELADYKKAHKLHAYRGRLYSWGNYYVIGLLIFGTVGGSLLAIANVLPWSIVFYPALILGIYVLVQFVIVPQQLKRVFNQQKDFTAPFEIELSDGEFSLKNQFGTSHLPWNAFVKWKEDKEILLLYRSDIMFNLLPKRLLSNEGEFEYVREKLRQNNVPPVNKVKNRFQTILVFVLIVIAIVVFLFQFRAQSAP